MWKAKDPDKQQQAGALAHRGFLARSRHIPVEALYAHATSQGKTLVLCGHSLGGAVALLCTLRLLQGLSSSTRSVQCICFGTPAVGNAALAAVVAEYGWESHILNFVLPEDIIPRMLALPAVPIPEKAEAAPQAADGKQQKEGAVGPDSAARSLTSVPAVAAGAVRSRLQNLRAILTAGKASTQQVGVAPTQQTPPDGDKDRAELGSAALSALAADATEAKHTVRTEAQAECYRHEHLGSENAGRKLTPAESPGRPVLQHIRNVANMLPGFNRTQPLPDSVVQSPIGQPQPIGSHDGPAQPDTESSPVTNLQEELQPQELQASDAKLGSSSWGLQNRVQGVLLGASNRVQALRSLLPAVPAYAHIGSHQILLPASPAMSEALKDAQKQGLAEEQQQTLNMHRMSAYRGRAIAICRSVIDWTSTETAPQVSLSTTLAPPITLIQSSVILPPLPQPDTSSTKQAARPVGPAQRQTLLHHSATPTEAATPAPHATDSKQQQQVPSYTALPAGNLRGATPVAGPNRPEVPVSHQRLQPGSAATQLGQPSTVEAGAVAQNQQPQPSADGHYVNATSQAQAVAASKRWPWQRPVASSLHSPPVDLLEAGMQGSARVAQRELRTEATPPADKTAVSSSGRIAFGAVAEGRPNRWLPPVVVRWQGGRQKQPPKGLIRIQVQGSTHSMPVRAQLHVMGRTWCRAWLLPSSLQQHRLPSPDAILAQQPTNTSWRHFFVHRLPWLQTHPLKRQHARPAMLFFQAEVPVTLLQAIADDTAQQHAHQQQQSQGHEQKQPHSQALQAPQGQLETPAGQPAMLLRLQTDFQTREQAVCVQLPVVWLIGTDTSASQAVWRLLTATGQTSNSHSTDVHSSPPGDGKAGSTWQLAQHRFKQAVSMVRRQAVPGLLQQPQPQLETSVLNGVHYAHIQAARMQLTDVLSCLLLLLSRFDKDSIVEGTLQPLGGPLQRLPARLRAVYHRQELQHLQSQLQDLRPPVGVLLAHGGAVDLQLSQAVTLVMKQARVMGIMRLGISRQHHIGSEGMFNIPANDWVEVLHNSSNAHSGMHAMKLQQRLRASLTAVLSGLSTISSKL